MNVIQINMETSPFPVQKMCGNARSSTGLSWIKTGSDDFGLHSIGDWVKILSCNSLPEVSQLIVNPLFRGLALVERINADSVNN